MKFFSLIACTILCLSATAQTQFNGAPGFMGAPGVFDATGKPVDYHSIQQKVKLRLGFQNASFSAKIPNNTIRVQIELGDKLAIDSTGKFNLSKAPLNQYFTWTVEQSAAGQLIVGTHRAGAAADFPPGFTGVFEFDVLPLRAGESVIQAVVSIHNANTSEKLNDPVEGDNTSNVSYKVNIKMGEI